MITGLAFYGILLIFIGILLFLFSFFGLTTCVPDGLDRILQFLAVAGIICIFIGFILAGYDFISGLGIL